MRFQAVFLDRDGVLNAHLPGAYVRNVDELGFIPGVAAAVRRLNDAGLPVVVISNQQGVGKGIMSENDLQIVQRHLEEGLAVEAGARIDAWYYCFDLAHQNSERRKPKPGMLYEAAAALDIDLARAAFIGDSPTDIGAGLAAPVGASVLVLSGATREYDPNTFTPKPDYVFPDLGSAVAWIVEEQS